MAAENLLLENLQCKETLAHLTFFSFPTNTMLYEIKHLARHIGIS